MRMFKVKRAFLFGLKFIWLTLLFLILKQAKNQYEVRNMDESKNYDLYDEFITHSQKGNVTRVGTKSVHCNCEKIPWTTRSIYRHEMNRNIEWRSLETIEYLSKRHPNYPVSIMKSAKKEICHLMPLPHEIHWSNRYWQDAFVSGTTYHLYSAFIDNRPLNPERPCVHILAMAERMLLDHPWCYIWFNATGPPLISKAQVVDIYGSTDRMKRLTAYLMTCRIPQEEGYRKPTAVSLVEYPCTKAMNLLEVIGDMERNSKTAFRAGHPPHNGDSNIGLSVAACGTSLYYFQTDYSIKLVEWFEILKAIGFSKVILHKGEVHPNINKVLQYYEEEGFLSVTHHHIPEPYLNEPSLTKLWNGVEYGLNFGTYVIAFGDCVLRHMHEHRFIGHLDPDEIPMLYKHDSYTSWLDDVLKKESELAQKNNALMPGFYSFHWRYQVDDVAPSDTVKDLPEYLWYLRHSQVPRKWVNGHSANQKCLYDTDVVTTVESHFPLRCLQEACKISRGVDGSVGYLGHFNSYYTCGKQCKEPNSTEELQFLLQYKEQIENKVTKSLKNLELI